MQIDLTALPDDSAVLQQMLREIVPELKAENEKLLLVIGLMCEEDGGLWSRRAMFMRN